MPVEKVVVNICDVAAEDAFSDAGIVAFCGAALVAFFGAVVVAFCLAVVAVTKRWG